MNASRKKLTQHTVFCYRLTYFWKQAALLIKKPSKASQLVLITVYLFGHAPSQSLASKLIIASAHAAPWRVKCLHTNFAHEVWSTVQGHRSLVCVLWTTIYYEHLLTSAVLSFVSASCHKNWLVVFSRRVPWAPSVNTPTREAYNAMGWHSELGAQGNCTPCQGSSQLVPEHNGQTPPIN